MSSGTSLESPPYFKTFVWKWKTEMTYKWGTNFKYYVLKIERKSFHPQKCDFSGCGESRNEDEFVCHRVRFPLASPASLCNLLSTANQVTKNLLLCVCGVTFLPTFVYNYKSLQRVAPIMNMRSEVRKTNSGNSSAQCHTYMVTRGGGTRGWEVIYLPIMYVRKCTIY